MLRSLPTDFELTQFIGKSLELVSFGQWKVHLHFSEGFVIGVEDEISVNSLETDDLPAPLAQIYPFINEVVTQVSVQETATLVFEFEHHGKLYIHASNTPYESYQIEHNGKMLAVV